MVNSYLKHFLLCGVAAAIGVLAWNGVVAAFALLPLIIMIWRSASRRWHAFLYLVFYYLGAARGQLSGASVYFADNHEAWSVGALVWLGSSALLALIWATLWHPAKRQGIRLIVILMLLALPPLGAIGWANPLTAAGVLFPGLAWLGLLATLALYYVIAESPRPLRLFPFAVLIALAYAFWEPVKPSSSWQGIDTQLGSQNDPQMEFAQLRQLQAIVMQHSRAAAPGTVFVLPEMVGGDWSQNRVWWDRVQSQLTAKQQTVLIGASQPVAVNNGYVNTVVSLGQHTGQAWVDRVPIPIAMWKPWNRPANVHADWLGTGLQTIGNTKAASLICYEQLLIWPVLASMVEKPDLIIAPANGWWAHATSLPATQRQTVQVWSQLFKVPVVFASNA